MFNLEIDKITKVLFGGFILGWVALSSTGCGSNSNVQQIVTKLTLRAYALNGDNWVEAKASLNTGNFILASINLPVLDPRHPDLVYGTLNIAPVLCSGICKGNADLTLGLNMTELTHAPAGDAVLPNGAPLPVGGLGQTPMIALPVSKTGARVYFAFGPGVVAYFQIGMSLD